MKRIMNTNSKSKRKEKLSKRQNSDISNSLLEAKKLIASNAALKQEYEAMLSALKGVQEQYNTLIKDVQEERNAFHEEGRTLISTLEKLRT